MNESDLHYLRSILRHLREMRVLRTALVDEPSLGGEALADNIDWLDCFIDKYERAQRKQKENFEAAMQKSRLAREAWRSDP